MPAPWRVARTQNPELLWVLRRVARSKTKDILDVLHSVFEGGLLSSQMAGGR
jgi:hypothetical protein